MRKIDPDTPLTGSCLCGAVRVRITAEPTISVNCHCLDCRKFFGAGHNTVAAFPADAVALEGETRGFTVVGHAGREVTRRFCPTCGGPVLGDGPGFPGAVVIPLAILDPEDAHGVAPQLSVFTRSAAPWDPPAEGLPAFETMPPS